MKGESIIMGYIIGITGQYGDISWVSNTDPIIWTNEITQAKLYSTIDIVKQELDENLDTLKTVVKENNIKDIFVIEVDETNYILINKQSKRIYLN